MRKSMLAKRIAAAVCAAVIASFAFAGSAFALTVHGTDSYGTGSSIQSGDVDVLTVDGKAGEYIFLNVYKGDQVVAKNYAYEIREDSSAAADMDYAGIVTLNIAGFDPSELSGLYTIEVYADRSGNTPLYSGALYGVYADLPDGTSKLIGTRTANSDELTARAYQPAETLFDNGKTYRLAGEATVSNGGVMHFPYEAYDEATTVDGVIKYVDQTGATVATTTIPGLKQGEARTVDIPVIITGEKDKSLYRTVCFQNSVRAENPGSTSFTIYCVKMSEANQALAGFYVATIDMVDENGTVIASDSVNVTGEFLYTAPTTIYKTVVENGEKAVITYTINGSSAIRLSAAKDGVLNRARTIEVPYTASKADPKEVNVTFTLVDGSKRVNEDGRVIETRQVTATKDAPAVPEAQIEVNGTKYSLAGSVDDYAYEVGSGEIPSIDVYYTPEGYTAPGSYEVTVNYVNYGTNDVIESHSYTSDPNGNARILISSPATFSANGVDYIRLDGQEDDIAHSYYSGNSTYVVYYRDKNSTLGADVTITRVRTVYDQNVVAADAGIAGVTTDATTPDGATVVGLNGERTYTAMDGADANGTLTNEAGIDSNTERIMDNETPLASGFDKGGSSSAASSFTETVQGLIPFGIGAIVVLVAAVVVITIRRRKADEEYEL